MSISSSGFKKYSKTLIILAAAVLTSVSLIYVSFVPIVPAIALLLFLEIKLSSGKESFRTGLLYGTVSSLILNYWMIAVVTNYAKGSVLLALLCYFGSSLILGLFFGLQFYLSVMLTSAEAGRLSQLINALTTAAVWVGFEILRSSLFSALPWLGFTVGVTYGRSLYLIQLAAFGQVFILSFMTVVIAYYLASAFLLKRWVFATVSAGLIAFQLCLGYLLYNSVSAQTAGFYKDSFSVTLAMPGLNPSTVWDEGSANNLVSHLFALNQKAAATKPDLIVWTETVVPWTYAPQDDFINELAQTTAKEKCFTLIGMNTAQHPSQGTIANSVYFLNPSGSSEARYDKQDLLGVVEKPLLTEEGGIILPFLSSYDLKMAAGANKGPIQMPWGKAGIMLCNESTNPFLAFGLVSEGAKYLINVGNDGWFSDCFITRQHFYNNRLRAVENRKDLIVNNNMGFCGVIRANGEIVSETDGKNAGTLTANIYPNNLAPVSSSIFKLFLAGILLFPVFNLFKRLLNKSK
nr:apolipoprotein N-acyltransferase [Pedobacter sp. SYSU D00535]